MINEWKRVRVRQWTPTSDVRVTNVQRVVKEFKPVPQQMFNNLIGVAVPIEHPDGIVVMPLEYHAGYDGRYGWQKYDPTTRYMIVDERWLEELGDAYEEECAVARKAMRAHRLTAEDPDELRLRRLRTRLVAGLESFLAENKEADDEKEARRLKYEKLEKQHGHKRKSKRRK